MEKIYAFIDSQNLNLSVLDQGWKLDFTKLYQFLINEYKVEKIYLFLGRLKEKQALYDYLGEIGYNIIFKPVLKGKNGLIKGNVDAELVLHTMIKYNYFNAAIIISGDGDFYCLIEYLKEKQKLFKIGIPNKHKYSSLLRVFYHYFFFISDLKHKLN